MMLEVWDEDAQRWVVPADTVHVDPAASPSRPYASYQHEDLQPSVVIDGVLVHRLTVDSMLRRGIEKRVHELMTNAATMNALFPPKPITRRRRLHRRWIRLRERVGFAIAGHDPTYDDD